jgi:proteasome assembly chaperone (PAC2) family protein
MPTIEHVLYIPGVFVIGVTLGYVLGARAVRAELANLRRRSKE